MNIFQTVLGVMVDFAVFVIQLILQPIDLILRHIDGLQDIPVFLNQLFSLIGSVPEFVVAFTGISSGLWNIMVTTIVLFLTAVPAVNAVKKVIAWVRP